MDGKKLLSKEEFLETTGLIEENLEKLIKAKVIKPAGIIDGKIPCFDESEVIATEAVKKLLDLGYSIEEVIKIRRKVGLPASVSEKKSPSQHMLTVGELARRIGTNPRTIKHWEEKGIIEPYSHSPGGFRLYHEYYVKLCILLQDLQNLGYTLDEIKVVADLVRDFLLIKKDPTLYPPEKAQEKFTQIFEQIKLLNEKMLRVEEGIKRWRKIQKQYRKEIETVFLRVKKEFELKEKKAKKAEKISKPQTQLSPA